MPAGKALRFLLFVRYVLGTLASGFLVAVPAQLLLRGMESHLLYSLGFGVVFLLGFLLLLPVSRFDWRSVTVPAFMRFQVRVSFASMLLSGVLLVASLLPSLERNREVFGFVLAITFFSWAQNKANDLLHKSRFENEEAPSPTVDLHAPTVVDNDTKIKRNEP